jgi:hypothetical protein
MRTGARMVYTRILFMTEKSKLYLALWITSALVWVATFNPKSETEILLRITYVFGHILFIFYATYQAVLILTKKKTDDN